MWLRKSHCSNPPLLPCSGIQPPMAPAATRSRVRAARSQMSGRDIGANVGVIPVRIHDDAGHEVLENGDRLMDCPLRGDELVAAGDVPERGVGLDFGCVEGGKVVEPVVVDRGEDPRDHEVRRVGHFTDHSLSRQRNVESTSVRHQRGFARFRATRSRWRRARRPACGGSRVEDRRLKGRLRRAGGHRGVRALEPGRPGTSARNGPEERFRGSGRTRGRRVREPRTGSCRLAPQ